MFSLGENGVGSYFGFKLSEAANRFSMSDCTSAFNLTKCCFIHEQQFDADTSINTHS